CSTRSSPSTSAWHFDYW
nr:immunoglobulin heavy chain junction region [Macaca mulatta]MOV38989.1 immunoglobulin heavy chain junction region [Macaca mulatta]MOV41226.1 immunoglobulin heavy chain junction region [Macaca mulatta]MOV42126.1 immunoglobulin heavy chain junction region [Macaca mulatta]